MTLALYLCFVKSFDRFCAKFSVAPLEDPEATAFEEVGCAIGVDSAVAFVEVSEDVDDCITLGRLNDMLLIAMSYNKIMASQNYSYIQWILDFDDLWNIDCVHSARSNQEQCKYLVDAGMWYFSCL